MSHYRIFTKLFLATIAAGALGLAGCKSDTETPDTPSFQVEYLVSDTAAYGSGVHIDPKLINGWGIAVGPTGNFWISATDGGYATIYDNEGVEKLPAVPIPSRDSVAGGTPTGQVYNSTSEFKSNSFIFVCEDGTISGWKSPDASAKIMYTSPSPNANYKGAALAKDGNIDYLYVTNFKQEKIEVFDGNFLPSSGRAFSDPTIPSGYSPFGIQNIDGKLYVSYAKRKAAPDDDEDEAGVGFGYVNIFNTDGTLFKRFASGGTLNVPWGIAKAPSSGFSDAFKDAILIANFGDGKVNAYDADGNFLGQIKDKNGNVIAIDGLWGIVFTTAGTNDGKTLYFTAGPYEESHGLFGEIEFE